MESNAFKNKLEQFRLHYKNTYGIEMDDETLYFFIRVNEMQIAISKQIKELPELKFERGLDYFWHGVGVSFKYLIAILIILVFIVILFVLSN